jgi:hypothetical protein
MFVLFIELRTRITKADRSDSLSSLFTEMTRLLAYFKNIKPFGYFELRDESAVIFCKGNKRSVGRE